MSSLLERLRRRRLPQWIAGYLAAAWLAFEVTGEVADTWGWSPLVPRLVFVALAVGLGWTAVLAWYHGESGPQRPTPVELGLLGALLAGGLVAAGLVRASSPGVGTPDPASGSAAADPPPAVADARSLVVLPFHDLSPDGAHEYLGDGIAETLIGGLGRLEELRVVARTSAFQFKGQRVDVREIGRLLGVGSVLEGSVAQVGERVRIAANLVDARTGLDLWSERFDREVASADLFELQDEVAQAILAALEIELRGGERVVAGGTRVPEAQRAFYLGMHHWTKRTAEDLARATDYFLEAIAADSSYAEAWAGLALTYVLHIPSEYDVPGLTPTEALDRAEQAARRAIELDPELAEPHAALASVAVVRGRPDESDEEFLRAIQKNPDYATAHHWRGDLLLQRLDLEGALREMEIAESLDPVAPAILAEKAQVLMAMGRYEEATAQLDRTLGLLPDASIVHLYAAWFAFRLGQWERAATHFGRRLELGGEDPEPIDAFVGALRDPERRADLLRRMADGRLANTFENLGEADRFDAPQARFFALLQLDGPGPALDYLEGVIRGPSRRLIYAPVIPAMMGPEVIAMPEARRVMRVLVETPEG